MKKKLLFSSLILFIAFFCIKVDAASRPTPYISAKSYSQGDTIDDKDSNITAKTGDNKQLYVYYHICNDMPTGNQGECTVGDPVESDDLTWSVSNDKLASIDSNGKITALQKGTVTVNVCIDDDTNTVCISKDVEISLNSSCVQEDTYRYTIKLISNGADEELEDVSLCPGCSHIALYTGEDESVKLPTPTREGYTFDGWYADYKYKVKITDIEEEYNKLDYDEEYENYCPLYKRTGNLYAKWSLEGAGDVDEELDEDEAGEKVKVPDTAFNSSKLILIVGLFLAFIGSVIVINTYNEKEN